MDSSVEALHDDNNNKHIFLSAADQKDYLECKSLYGRLHSHPISIDKSDQVKLLVSGEMPDAAKSLANSGEWHPQCECGVCVHWTMTPVRSSAASATPVHCVTLAC